MLILILLLAFLSLGPPFFGGLAVASEKAGVVISEVAWMGTKASSYDEWLELYNRSSDEVNLEGYTIAASGKKLIELTGKIRPHSFYIIERGDDDVISNLNASESPQKWSKSLLNGGEVLELKNPDGVSVDVVDCGEKWCAGDSKNRKTMQRDLETNKWFTESVQSEFLDGAGNRIYGTPGGPGVSPSPIEVNTQTQDEDVTVALGVLPRGGKDLEVSVTLDGEVPGDIYRYKLMGDVLLWSEEHDRWAHHSNSWNDSPRVGSLADMAELTGSGDLSARAVVRNSRTLKTFYSEKVVLAAEEPVKVASKELSSEKSASRQYDKTTPAFAEPSFYAVEEASGSSLANSSVDEPHKFDFSKASLIFLASLGVSLPFSIYSVRMLKSKGEFESSGI